MSSFSAMFCVFTSFALITIVPLILTLITIVIAKHRASKTLESKYFKENYGTMISGLNTNNFTGAYWSIIILIRWSVTISVIISFRDYTSLQIISLYLTSGAIQLFIIRGKPFDSTTDNVMAIFNEVMVSSYLLMLMMIANE